MISKRFQTCYSHSLFFYDKFQKPKLKENKKIPGLQHTSLSKISSLAVNSYCHGFKKNVKHLGIWCQSHQMALFHSAHFISNYTQLPIHYHLLATPPWRVFSLIFSSLPFLKFTGLMQSFTLPPTNPSSFKSQHGVHVPQEAWSSKWGAEEMCWLPNVERLSFPSLGNDTYLQNQI